MSKPKIIITKPHKIIINDSKYSLTWIGLAFLAWLGRTVNKCLNFWLNYMCDVDRIDED